MEIQNVRKFIRQIFYLLLLLIVAISIASLSHSQETQAALPGATPTYGGQILIENRACTLGFIWVELGPPVGGPYIWAPSTRTYEGGKPSGPGEWLLGVSGPPGTCVCGPGCKLPGVVMIFGGGSR